MNVYIWKDWSYEPTADTLFYIKNNGDIKDYSQYNHTLNRYGTSSFTTLDSGIKVAHLDGTNGVYSDYFTESIGTNKFTMHMWFKGISSPSAQYTMGGWMGRAASSTTTDRWGAKWQGEANSANLYIIYGANNANWQQNTSVNIPYSTTDFQLYTLVADGKTMTIYRNGVQAGSWSGSYDLVGGSNTGTSMYYGIGGHYDGTTPTNLMPGYWGEIILEKGNETVSQIQDYYNNTKSKYIGEFEPYTPNANTLLYCPLKDDILDHNNSPKTITQTGTVTKGDIGYYFNGGYLTTSSFVGPSGNNTMSIWVKPNSMLSTHQNIFNKYYGSNSSPYITTNLSIISNGSTVQFQTANGSGTVKTTTATITYGSWQYIVGVFDGSNIKIYMNGTLISSVSQSGGTYSNNTSMFIGSFSGNSQYFYGYISDAIFESKARTDAEIQEYYNRTKGAYGL